MNIHPMCSFSWFVTVMAAVLIQSGCSQSGAQETAIHSQPDAKGFAVIELFTSEGCSSCPPADELLAKIIADARASGMQIYPMAFHVDYWDRLGWRDSFSSAEASSRQQHYAQAFKSEQIYTPQMIVNGRTEFVGSDKAQAEKAISNAMSHPAGASLSLSLARQSAGQLVVNYAVETDRQPVVLNLVLVERGLKTKVARGENGGRTLSHENVVRTLKSIDITEVRGQAVLDVPKSVDSAKTSVIGFLQNKQTMEISAAASFDLQLQPTTRPVAK